LIIFVDMTGSKKDFIKAFELLVNTLDKDDIQGYFGEKTRFVIRDIVFSPVKNNCLIDCQVILGDQLDIPVESDEFVKTLIQRAADNMISDFKINVMVKYDV